MAGLLLPPLRRRVLPTRTGACVEKTPANLRERVCVCPKKKKKKKGNEKASNN